MYNVHFVNCNKMCVFLHTVFIIHRHLNKIRNICMACISYTIHCTACTLYTTNILPLAPPPRHILLLVNWGKFSPVSSKIKYLNTVQKEKVYDILQSIKLKSTFNNFNKFQKINPCK